MIPQPLIPLFAGGGLMSAGGMPSGTSPQLNWQHKPQQYGQIWIRLGFGAYPTYCPTISELILPFPSEYELCRRASVCVAAKRQRAPPMQAVVIWAYMDCDSMQVL